MPFNLFHFIFVIILHMQSIYGGDIADELTRRYYDGRMTCTKRHQEHPAYECSGIMIRGINSGQTIAWKLRQGNIDRGSLSLAYLRKDAPFTRFPSDYNAGMIFYPHLKTPKGKKIHEVYCAFPLNAHTDARKDHGCGMVEGDTDGVSTRCDDQNITSFYEWKTYFSTKVYSSSKGDSKRTEQKQCGFNMRKQTAARDFSIVMKANKFLVKRPEFSFKNNEILFESWKSENPKDLPIEAFFYLIDHPNAKERAILFQNEYLKQTGEKVPAVGILLPTKNRKIKFV